jgi:hypothetical protein
MIKEELKAPKRKATINRAIQHQERIRFHAQVNVATFHSQPLTDFIQWVGTLIPKDKLKIFKSLFRFPVKTNQITGICFDKLSRVFDGRNPAFNYQFLNSEQRDDWEYYRQNVLKEPTVWQTKGWEYFKTEINSVLVIDMPTDPDPLDKYPQPYFYWLTIDNVISYKADATSGVMDFIIFKQGKNKIAVFDKEDFQVFAYDDAKKEIGELLIDNPHDLGYCPARFFWDEPLKLSDPDVKSSPITKELESLDWFLFFHISKRHLDLYAPYPIYSGYEQDCGYTSDKGETCDGGYVVSSTGVFNVGLDGALQGCPKCGDKRIAGVGSFVEVPIPSPDGNGDYSPDLRNPVQILTIDAKSLQYNVDEVARLKNEIITSTVGVDNDNMSSEAMNEKQVSGNFESQSTILNRVKKGFESAQQFVDETICKLRYGKSFVSAKINLGTEFYIEDPMALRDRYSLAKESGASESELDSMQRQIMDTEYRHNPTELQRMLILSELEPYRHLTRQEIIDLNTKGIITNDELYIKLNFVNLVRRFERENTNILEFGTQINYDKKINIINQKLKDYASENKGGGIEGRTDPKTQQ